MITRDGVDAYAAAGGFCAKQGQLSAEILDPRNDPVPRLVDQVAAIDADGIIIPVPIAGEGSDTLLGNKCPRPRLPEQLVPGHQPCADIQDAQKLRALRGALISLIHIHYLGRLIDQQAPSRIWLYHLQAILHDVSLDIAAVHRAPGAHPGPAVRIQLPDDQPRGLPVDVADFFAAGAVIYRLMAQIARVRHGHRGRHGLPDTLCIHAFGQVLILLRHRKRQRV